jgi:hypothetical protein
MSVELTMGWRTLLGMPDERLEELRQERQELIDSIFATITALAEQPPPTRELAWRMVLARRILERNGRRIGEVER